MNNEQMNKEQINKCTNVQKYIVSLLFLYFFLRCFCFRQRELFILKTEKRPALILNY